jgi:hypothetical protein
MRTVLQSAGSYDLDVDIAYTEYGHSLRFITFISDVNKPEEQVKFQVLLSTSELEALRDFIEEALIIK